MGRHVLAAVAVVVITCAPCGCRYSHASLKIQNQILLSPAGRHVQASEYFLRAAVNCYTALAPVGHLLVVDCDTDTGHALVASAPPSRSRALSYWSMQ